MGPPALRGLTPRSCSKLGRAAYVGDSEKVRELLDEGEDPKTLTSAGAFLKDVAPVHLAAAGGSTECVELLLKAGASAEDTFARIEHELVEDGPRAGQSCQTEKKFYPKDVAASGVVFEASKVESI